MDHNLQVRGHPPPQPLTTFIGRSTELRDIDAALSQHRIVSLVGSGGCGKTRLAIEVARARSAPVWFVDLSSADEGSVPAAMAAASSSQEAPAEEPIAAVARRIGDGVSLLVLDTCEVDPSGCAMAAEALVRACPDLTVLATSLVPMGAEGERVIRVQPLSVDADGGDALRLFLDRVSRPDELPGDDLRLAAAICRRLDGVPLAIELAASRGRALPLADVLAGLDDRFRLLDGTATRSTTRHRSLAASVEWSHRLLGDDARLLLRRLSVFRGSFAADAARAVGGIDGIDERDVLRLLAELVDHSFVVVENHGAVSRYRLLETIREYAASELSLDRADEESTKDRHLVWIRDWAERVETVFDGPALARHVNDVAAALADVKFGLAWAARRGNADDGLRLIAAIGWFWHVRPRGDARALYEAALSIQGGDDRWRAKCLAMASWSATSRFELDGAALGAAAVEHAEAAGDPAVSARAEAFLGWSTVLASPRDAATHFARAEELARESGDDWIRTLALIVRVNTELADLRHARRLAEEAHALAVAHGYALHGAGARYVLAMVEWMQGDLDDAARHTQQALDAADAIGNSLDATICLCWLTLISWFRAEDEAVAAYALRAAATAETSGNRLHAAAADAALGFASLTTDDPGAARRRVRETVPLLSIVLGGALAPLVLRTLAESALASGEVAEARADVEGASSFAEAAESDWARAHAELVRARLHLFDTETVLAAEASYRALDLAERVGDRLAALDALQLIAEVLLRRDEPRTAAVVLGAVASARAQLGYRRGAIDPATPGEAVMWLRTALGDEGFDRAWAEGTELALADAVAVTRRGRGPRGRPVAGWQALTPAEMRVAELVGEGLTNKQIAARLFVSDNTIKGHISSALRKLAVRNRAELAAEAARR